MTTSPAEEHLEVRVVAHTHWDREWYRPEPQFRQRLVALIDEILDRVRDDPFLLDGQAILLEDYLGMRPERAADLSSALRRGAIEAGPWYVLADELIPSGEGLVRNLLAGRRVLQSLRASPPAVLYCPDSFGHPAALPTIASGFGCATIVLWRGFGGRRHPPGDTARWIAPGGESAVLCHLPPDGYEFGSHLPSAPEPAAQHWQALRSVLALRSSIGVVLLTVGADHHACQPDLEAALEVLASVAAPDSVRRSSLDQAGEAIAARAAAHDIAAVRGELRDSYGYAWTLQGTLGTRSALKRRYAIVESSLIRDGEPWVMLARRVDGGADRRHLLRAAWRPILLCQPHDTLCGCSIDAVADAMRGRLDEAEAALEGIRQAAIDDLLGHDTDAASGASTDWRPEVVVRNRCPRPRAGIAELDVDVVLAEVRVGPHSAGVRKEVERVAALSVGHPALATQELKRDRVFAREESARHYPRNRLIERRRVLAWIGEVPAYGLVTLPLLRRRGRPAQIPGAASATRESIASDVARVEITADGLTLHWHDGRVIADWLTFEVEGEQGDLYTASPIPGTLVTGRPSRVRVTAAGPLRAALRADWRMVLAPRRLTRATGQPYSVPRQRVEVRVTVELDAGARFVRVAVSGVNRSSDARLRLVLRTGLPDARVTADAAFGPVERAAPDVDGTRSLVDVAVAVDAEQPTVTAPLHRYVSLYHDTVGATVFSDGLREYESREDGSIAVTIFRAVGELSRCDLRQRPGHAGYPVETPGAQEPGWFGAQLAFALHGPRTEAVVAAIESMADDVLWPLAGHTWRTAIDAPPQTSGVQLVGAGLAFSAAKDSEDGAWMVLRCTNLLERDVDGVWRRAGLSEARLARLDETPLGVLPVHEGVVRFVAPPRATITILAR
ncbi:MAG TPA: hypothetical protein VF981_10300 [Gemmatimonadaceae bacterium]